MFYRLPDTLENDLEALSAATESVATGETSDAEIDKLRIAHGSYGQRQHGVRMVRVRTPGGAVTPGQLRAMSDIADAYGSNVLHVTTRQEFQIHNLRAGDIVNVMRDLLKVGLATRGGGGGTVRNILVTPGAGVSEGEVFDPSAHAFALTSRLMADPTSWQLPRKFKISFANGPHDGAYALLNDVGFVATIKDGSKGFQVFIAGGAGNKPEVGHLLHDFIPESETWAVTEALKRLFAKHGDWQNRARARMRFLWARLGAEAFRAFYEVEYQALRAENPPDFVAEPLPPIPDVAPYAGPVNVDAGYDLWRARFVRGQCQPGRFLVTVPVKAGNLGTETARRLADFLEPLGPDTIRATFGQNIHLRHIPEDRLSALWKLLTSDLPLSFQPQVLGKAIACTGASTCKLGICRSPDLLDAILEALTSAGLDLDALGPFTLNLSGCPNACGHHLMADLGLSGGATRADGRLYPVYTLFSGARAGVGQTRLAVPFGKIAARAVPAAIVDLLRLWLDTKDTDGDFGDWVHGAGAADVTRLLETYATVPTFDEDPTFYQDWGMNEPFALRKP